MVDDNLDEEDEAMSPQNNSSYTSFQDGQASQADDQQSKFSTEPVTQGQIQEQTDLQSTTEIMTTPATECESENLRLNKLAETSRRVCKRNKLPNDTGRSTSSAKKTTSTTVREEDNALRMISHAIRDQVNKSQVIKTKDDDQYDAYGRYVAYELRSINEQYTRDFIMQEIGRIFFNAKWGSRVRSSSFGQIPITSDQVTGGNNVSSSRMPGTTEGDWGGKGASAANYQMSTASQGGWSENRVLTVNSQVPGAIQGGWSQGGWSGNSAPVANSVLSGVNQGGWSQRGWSGNSAPVANSQMSGFSQGGWSGNDAQAACSQVSGVNQGGWNGNGASAASICQSANNAGEQNWCTPVQSFSLSTYGVFTQMVEEDQPASQVLMTHHIESTDNSCSEQTEMHNFTPL